MHYIVIGGWLPQFLDKHRWIGRIVKKMAGVYVETAAIKKALEQRGFNNVRVIRNFKNDKPLTQEELIYTWTSPYPLCTFSRIMNEKGIEDAVNAVILANEKLGAQIFGLDIYGPVEAAYQSRWDEMKKSFPAYIRDAGPVAAEKSTQTVKNYYALLFPTQYPTEGFAGTLIDAMNAGVPVIATDWESNREIVIPNITGILTPPHSPEELAERLVRIAEDPQWWNGMKISALAAAENYSPKQMIRVLIENLA